MALLLKRAAFQITLFIHLYLHPRNLVFQEKNGFEAFGPKIMGRVKRPLHIFYLKNAEFVVQLHVIVAHNKKSINQFIWGDWRLSYKATVFLIV